MARRFALGVAMALAIVPASPAAASTFCVGTVSEPSCEQQFSALQPALDAASANPDGDSIRVGRTAAGSWTWDTAQGFSYSDGGDAANSIVLSSPVRCDHGVCRGPARLRKTTPGGTLLSFTGTGGAIVNVGAIDLAGPAGGTGLRLGPRSSASALKISGADTGVVLDGSAAWPARLLNSPVSARLVAVDVPQGHGVIDFAPRLAAQETDTALRAETGVRAGGPGLVTLIGAKLFAETGVDAVRVRVGDSFMRAATGFSIACSGPGSADASLELADVTVVGDGSAGSVPLEVLARGGDGQGCNATADVTSSVLTGFALPAAFVGEAGTGSAPVPGTASASLRYSDLDPALRLSQPATVNTTSPGGNLFAEPRLWIGDLPGVLPLDLQFRPLWNSPLIDRGDPGPRAPWQQEVPRRIDNGRRDVGLADYRFEQPYIKLVALPARVAVGSRVAVYADYWDIDFGDPLRLTGELDGKPVELRETSDATPRPPTLERRFRSVGRHRVTATVVDPVGLLATDAVEIVVRRPAVRKLALDRGRMRARQGGRGFAASCGSGAIVTYDLAGTVPVRFTVQRLVAKRWRRLSGGFTQRAQEGGNELCFRGRLNGRRLKPGRYRLVAKPRGGRSVVRGIRIIR
jgi:hypothetical protein